MTNPSPTPEAPKPPACVPTSFWFHLLTFVFLSGGFVVGGVFAWRCQFVAKVGEDLPSEPARTYLVALCLGLLGATTQLSIGWAKAVNAQLTGESRWMPCPLEPLGYLLKLVWGAITGVIANLAAQAGAMVTVHNASAVPLKPEASALLAFCSGLTAFRMLTWMSGLFRPKDNPVSNGAVPGGPSPASVGSNVAAMRTPGPDSGAKS